MVRRYPYQVDRGLCKYRFRSTCPRDRCPFTHEPPNVQLPQNEWAGSGPNNVFESGRAFGLVQDGAHLPNPYADLESVPRLGNFYKLFAEVQTINQDLQQLQALKSGEPTIHNGAGPYPHLWNAGLHMPAISFTQMPQRPGTRTKFPPVPSAPVAFKKPPPMYNNVAHLSTLPHPVTRSETSRESFQTFRMIKASLLKKANQGVDGLNPLSYKTSPCKHFTLLGSCPLGNACNFVHDPNWPWESPKIGGKKSTHCWAHVQGHCRVPDCPYQHPTDVSKFFKYTPCLLWPFCTTKDCPFTHPDRSRQHADQPILHNGTVYYPNLWSQPVQSSPAVFFPEPTPVQVHTGPEQDNTSNTLDQVDTLSPESDSANDSIERSGQDTPLTPTTLHSTTSQKPFKVSLAKIAADILHDMSVTRLGYMDNHGANTEDRTEAFFKEKLYPGRNSFYL